MDLSCLSQIDLKTKLVVYENAEDNYFHVIRKKSQEIQRTDKCNDDNTLKKLFYDIKNISEDEDFDELIIKLPYIPIAIQILDTPQLSDRTIAILQSFLVQTSIPIFVYVNSIVFEVKLSEKYYEILKNVINNYSECYYYVLFTKIDLLDFYFKNSIEFQIDLFTFNLKNFLQNLEKIGLKLIGLSFVSNQKQDEDLYMYYINFLKDFNYTNLAVMRIDYFKCLLKSSINKFSLAFSKKKNSFNEKDREENFNLKCEKFRVEFDQKLFNFFESLPTNKEEAKKNFTAWYKILKKNLKENYEHALKNKSYICRKNFMNDHIELVKPCFENLIKDKVKEFIISLIPTITLNDFPDLCGEALQKVKNSYKFGSYIGLWTKNGVYSDIIVKLFKRIKENQSKVKVNCKDILNSSLKQKSLQLDNTKKNSDVVKSFLKIIDSQEFENRNINVYNTSSLLKNFINTKHEKFLLKLNQILKNINV